MRQRYQEELLDRCLHAVLGELEPDALALLRERLRWVQIGAGELLMSEGEAGDSMYLVVSGRLRAYLRDADGAERAVREMGRGQVVGEMALYTDAPRSATVAAVRDTVLVQLAREDLRALLAHSAQLSIALTRQLIRRLNGQGGRAPQAPPVTVALVPVSAGTDASELAARLAGALGRHGRAAVLDAAAAGAADDTAFALQLDRLEAEHDVVLLVAGGQPDAWTQRCCRHADEILLLADADEPPVLHATETGCLIGRGHRAEAAETLLLLHPADRPTPRGTRHWLDRRPVADHVHLRRGHAGDLARLARLLRRAGIGLVFAGGGARGFAHLGIWRALAERGIEIDAVGGTSIGAVMAVAVASGRAPDEAASVLRRSFAVNPTGDFNWLPLLSLIKGRRLRQVIEKGLHDLLGPKADAEDLWKGFYCVASNYSQAREQRLARGDLARALRASVAIPGALPPVVIDGDLLCDGGTFNNFPVDAMRERRGIGTVIGVDLDFRKPRRIEQDEPPGSLALWRDRWRPWAKRRYRFPSLMAYLMNVTILYSSSRRREAQRLCDLFFSPPLERVGMLQWNKFDAIVAQGRQHAEALLDALPPEQLARLRSTAQP